jgi:hypothetical protein
LVEAYEVRREDAARELASLLPEFAKSGPTSEDVERLLGLVSQVFRMTQRVEQAVAADELLAFRRGRTTNGSARQRTLPMSVPAPASLGPDVLIRALVSDQDQIPLQTVASMLLEPLSKLVQVEPETMGVSSRDRLTSRALHPVRMLADRLARGFGDLRFDVYVDATGTKRPRLLPGEIPALVFPQGFADLPETDQAAPIARLLALVALDIPWIEEVPADDVDGILFGGLRSGFELWAQGELSPNVEMSAGAWRVRIAKVAGRKLRRSLDEMAQRIKSQSGTLAWRQAMRIASLRAAYAMTGDLTFTLDEAMWLDQREELVDDLPAKLLANPVTRELILFALSDAGTALRRNVGSA